MDAQARPRDDGRSEGGTSGLVVLILVGAVGGMIVGLVGAGFRRCLLRADDLRLTMLHRAQGLPGPGWIVPVVAVSVCALAARLIVRRVPGAAGSGIQDVEAVWRGDADPPSGLVLPATFVGGLVAIGSGLALGREGPTVHMGAVVGSEAGRHLRMSAADIRVLQTAFGGAGLAVAFNAPLGGALFVFEEVTRSFRTRLAAVTLIGCATAIASSRLILSPGPDFVIREIPTPPGWHLGVFVVFGLLTGLLGVLYNKLILGGLGLSDRLTRIGPEVKAAVVGAMVGLLLFVDPLAAGGGHLLTQRVLGGVAVTSAVGYSAVRFVIGPLSYAAGTPGGLFQPLLAVGALWGVLFHAVAHGVVPGLTERPAAFAVVGMAAFFAAVVQAPFTGIVLVVEITASTTLLGPLLAACSAVVLIVNVVQSTPIYDSLWKRVLIEPRGVRSGPHDASGSTP